MQEKTHVTTEERFYQIVRSGFYLLYLEKNYTQKTLVKKFKTLGYVISQPSISNILRSRATGFRTLKTASEGIRLIVKYELGLEYNQESQDFVPIKDSSDWHPYVVPEEEEMPASASGMVFHVDGRVTIQQKNEFISTAQREVIEFGIRLKTFSDYFFSRNESEYKTHITELLRKGVTIKSYLLDPDCNEARLYFEDRARVQFYEKEAILEAKKVIMRLHKLMEELNNLKYPGSFEVYTYKHIPQNSFVVVDADRQGGKMMVSHYIYGIRRADCPVWEFTQSDQPRLYQKYLESLKHLTSSAKLISI